MRSGLRGISWGGARGGGTRWAWVLSFAGHAVFVGIGFLVVWSVEPGMRDPGAKTTAAAATGPAKGLMPASSTPAT